MIRERKMTSERKVFITCLLEYCQPNGEQDMQKKFQDLLGDTLQGMLDVEMDQNSDYSKYDYRNMETDDNCNGCSKKRSFLLWGQLVWIFRETEKENLNYRLSRKSNGYFQYWRLGLVYVCERNDDQRYVQPSLRCPEFRRFSKDDLSHDRLYLPIAKEWQNRPLEHKYAITFMDVIHFYVRENNWTVKKAAHVSTGEKLNSMREVLGMLIGGNESEKYWLGVLNEIKNNCV